MYSIENKLSQMLFPCDTTIIEKNYNNFTYYSKRSKFNILTPIEMIKKICLYRKETQLRIFQINRMTDRDEDNRYEVIGFKRNN